MLCVRLDGSTDPKQFQLKFASKEPGQSFNKLEVIGGNLCARDMSCMNFACVRRSCLFKMKRVCTCADGPPPAKRAAAMVSLNVGGRHFDTTAESLSRRSV